MEQKHVIELKDTKKHILVAKDRRNPLSLRNFTQLVLYLWGFEPVDPHSFYILGDG